MGTLYIVGFGPGGPEHMTQKAVSVIQEADEIIGYTTYTKLLKEVFPDKQYQETGMRREVERCRLAVERAAVNHSIALVSSGDSGIYGMAGIAMEILLQMQEESEEYQKVQIVTVPGVTAASAAASLLGAPLMHDFAVISLSDLMTPAEQIWKRVEGAGIADFIVCLYNPKSKKRVDYVEIAADLLMKYRSCDTPVGVVTRAGREGEKSIITTLGKLKEAEIDMFSIVIIGNSSTYVKHGRMITPRGYQERNKSECEEVN